MARHRQAVPHYGPGRAGQGAAEDATVGTAHARGAARRSETIQDFAETFPSKTTVPAGTVGGVSAASRGAAQATGGRRQNAQARTETPRQTEGQRVRTGIATSPRSRQVRNGRGARMVRRGAPLPASASIA